MGCGIILSRRDFFLDEPAGAGEVKEFGLGNDFFEPFVGRPAEQFDGFVARRVGLRSEQCGGFLLVGRHIFLALEEHDFSLENEPETSVSENVAFDLVLVNFTLTTRDFFGFEVYFFQVAEVRIGSVNLSNEEFDSGVRYAHGISSRTHNLPKSSMGYSGSIVNKFC